MSIPILTSVTGPAKVVQVSPASSSPTLTALGREGKTNGVFFRTITSDALQGTAAAKYALDQGLKKLSIIHVNNDFGVNMVDEFSQGLQGARRRDRLGHALQREAVELSGRGDRRDGRRRPTGSISSAIRSTAPPSRAQWISQGGPPKFLLNDGMNSADFITNVGAEYLNDAYRHLVGHRRDRLDRIFQRQLQGLLRPRSGQPGRRSRPMMPAPSSASPSRRPARRDSAAIKDAIRKVLDPERRQ